MKDNDKNSSVDLLNDIFLANKNIVIFSAQLIGNVLTNPINLVFSDFASFGIDDTIPNLNYLLEHIDRKSEMCELSGIELLLKEFREELGSTNQYGDFYLPLNFEGVKYFFTLKTYRFPENNIMYFVMEKLDTRLFNMEDLYSQSYKDMLSGLFNYTTFKYHFKICTKNQYLGVFDVDNFKDINDTYGHNKGDEVLSEIGRRIIAEVSDENIIVYRKSGDEFIFMTAKPITRKTLELYIKKIQTCISEIFIPTRKVSASIGYIYYQPASDLYKGENALIFADIAMYMSKHNGKNTITYLTDADINRMVTFDKPQEILKSLSKGRHVGEE
jgi:diguanylate cyclase (GGDEF)-like protein